MKKLDFEKLDKLMDQKKWPEAKSLLDNYLSSETATNEPGEANFNMASLYLRVRSALNKEYETLLRDSLEVLKKLNNEEKKIQIRAKLSQ